MRDELTAIKMQEIGDVIEVTGYSPNEKNRKAVWQFQAMKADRAGITAKVLEMEADRKAIKEP